MTGPNRSPLRGSVGNGGDPRHVQAVHRSSGLPPDEGEVLGAEDPWEVDDEDSSPLDRFDLFRRKYIPYPDEVVYEFLGEEEVVVHSDHPSFRAFLIQNVILVILIPIVGPLFAYFGLGAIVSWETVLGFLLFALIIFALALRRIGDRYTSYVITNMRLIKVTGILRRQVASIPWTGMTGLGFNQTAMGRILGYATIKVESANEESGLREFGDVTDPALFHQKLLDMASTRNRAAVARQAQAQAQAQAAKRRKRRRRGGGTDPGASGRRVVGRTGGVPSGPPDEPGEPSSGRDVGRPKVREGPPGRAVFADLADDVPPEDDADAPWPDEDPAGASVDDDPEAPWEEATTPPEGQPRVTLPEEDEGRGSGGRTRSGRPRPRPRPRSWDTPPTGQPPVDDVDEGDSPAFGPAEPYEEEPGRRRRGWRGWWPGSGTAEAEPEETGESDDRPRRRSGKPRGRGHGPAQQAPRKPETIVVPRQAPPQAPPSGRPPGRGPRS